MPNKNVVVLSNKDHKNILYTPINNYSFAILRSAVPLLPFEVPEASTFFPVIFPDENSVSPYAILGLKGKNIFIDDNGHWKTPYIPLTIYNYPFSLIQANFSNKKEQEDKTIEVAIAIDKDAPHFNMQNGHRLFTEDGEPTEILNKIKNSLINQYKGYMSLEKSLKDFSSFNVIEEKVVTVSYKGEEKKIGGLRCVDKEKLFALSDEVLARFTRNGVMELIFAHWHSLKRLSIFFKDQHDISSIKNTPIQ